jgi:peptide/nickel transport system permease protein
MLLQPGLKLGNMLVQSAIKIVGITSIVYLVFYSIPGHLAVQHGKSPRTEISSIENERGVGHAVIGYLQWGAEMLRGDWGIMSDGTPISEQLKQDIPRTLLLVCGSLVISLLMALFMVFASLRWQHIALIRSGITLINLLSGIHIIVLCYLFFLFGLVIPNQGFSFWLLVILALGNGALVDYFNVLRTQVNKVLSRDYVGAAQARGADPLKHATRYEIFLAIVEATSSRIPALIGGTIIVEYVFSYYGIGYDVIKAVEERHFDLTMGVTTVLAIWLIGVTEITQFLRQQFDPKLHH